ncbi:ATP-binding protein [Flagellimonas sp. DF-77]|uniref:AAA family ATPase n=1 Tax=Flagellimonas algarum TaxID=3230298 RepID=UPI00339835BD
MRKIVVTGAPGTGKTVVIEALEAAGYPCFHEIIRSMTAEAKSAGTIKEQVSNPLAFVDDPYAFNRSLLQGRIDHFLKADKQPDALCFFDRGIPDVLAYMDYFDQAYEPDFTEACETHRYDAVYILPPWKAIYVSDNERLETFEEAEALHEYLMATYTRFGYTPVTVPKTTIENRTDFVLKDLNLK